MTVVALAPPVPFRPFSSGRLGVGEGVSLPRPRIQVVLGTVPQKRARNTRPARSDVLYRPAIEALRCHPLPTSSTRGPGCDTQLMWLRLRSISSVPTMLTTRSAPAHWHSARSLRRMPSSPPARLSELRVHNFRGLDSLRKEANPSIDLPQPPLSILIVSFHCDRRIWLTSASLT
jgi:hypothetical protein